MSRVFCRKNDNEEYVYLSGMSVKRFSMKEVVLTLPEIISVEDLPYQTGDIIINTGDCTNPANINDYYKSIKLPNVGVTVLPAYHICGINQGGLL